MKTVFTLLFLTCLPAGFVHAQSGNALPFERGVRIEVVAAKPAKIKGGDYDDKVQSIELRLKFTNQDTRQSYDGYSATVSVIGQSARERDVRKVLLQEKIDLPLTPRKVAEHTCKTVTTRFDKTDAVFGFWYDGWVIVVKDKSGKIVQVKSTAPTLEKLPEKVDKLAQETCFDKKLEAVTEPGRSPITSIQ
jgi:hypothetical protein